ncbi:MAG: hypothetical protein Q9227_001667 [Pyrenula ochraceoflavens]
MSLPALWKWLRIPLLILLLSIILFTTLFLHPSFPPLTTFKIPHYSSTPPTPSHYNLTTTVAVASTTQENTTWLSHSLPPTFQTAIYVADDPNGPLHPPLNKGHEPMSYLSYIIDHYESLPDISIFIHAHRRSWHTPSAFSNDMSLTLHSLNLSYVQQTGYFNLKCEELPGCVTHINLTSDDYDPFIRELGTLRDTWPELHPDVPMPETLGAPCCSQFAVTRELLQRISRERWERYREWVVKTWLSDDLVGRVWEYTWHFILTGEAGRCPVQRECFCRAYGVCFGKEGELEKWLERKKAEVEGG